MEFLQDLFERLRVEIQKPVWIAAMASLAGALLAKIVPALWGYLRNLSSWTLRQFGGRLAHRRLQEQLMDRAVIQLRELKLTGVVSADDDRRPTLEDVFVSLRVAEHHPSSTPDPLSDLFEWAKRRHPEWTDQSRLRSLLYPLAGQDLAELREIDRLSARVLRSPIYRELLRAMPVRARWGLIGSFWMRLALGRVATVLIQWSRRHRNDPDRKHDSEASKLRDRSVARLWALEKALTLDPDPNAARLKAILRQNRFIAVLGPPGSGKTTLLQFIALSYAREKAGDRTLRRRHASRKKLGATRWRLPVFVPLGAAAPLLAKLKADGKSPSLLTILPQLLDPELRREYEAVAPGYFLRRAKNGECIFLLDGLDEVPADADFATVVDAIESLAAYAGNRFVVTSRAAGWRQGFDHRFKVCEVAELTADQIETFVDAWYEAVERNAVAGGLKKEGATEREARHSRTRTRAAELKTALARNTSIARLATNPMLLSIIAMVHRRDVTLPDGRAMLYDKCTELLLELWDTSRNVRLDVKGLRLDQKETLMRRLALAMHAGEIGGETGGVREVSRAEVLDVLGPLLPGMGRESADADALLRQLSDRSGLVVERRRDVIGFAHLTFQEYFAAQALQEDEGGSTAMLTSAERLFNPWWREVLLLFAGLVADTSLLLSAILTGRDEHRTARLQLAGSCRLEATQVKEVAVQRLLDLELVRWRTAGAIQSTTAPLAPALSTYLARWAREQPLPAPQAAPDSPAQVVAGVSPVAAQPDWSQGLLSTARDRRWVATALPTVKSQDELAIALVRLAANNQLPWADRGLVLRARWTISHDTAIALARETGDTASTAVARTILARAEDASLRRAAVAAMIGAQGRGSGNSQLLAASKARRGDLSESSTAYLVHLIASDIPESSAAALCLGRLVSCEVGSQSVLPLFQELLLRPYSWWERMGQLRIVRTLGLVSVGMRSQLVHSWSATAEGVPNRIPKALIGLDALATGCDLSAIADTLVRFIETSTHHRSRALAAAILSRQPAHVGGRHAYDVVVAFYRDWQDASFVDANFEWHEEQWDAEDYLADGREPEARDQVAHHPIVRILDWLAPQDVDSEVRQFLHDGAGSLLGRCAAHVIRTAPAQFTSETDVALGSAIRRANHDVYIEELLRVAGARIELSSSRDLLEAVALRLDSPNVNTRDLAFEILRSHHERCGEWLGTPA